MCRWPLTISPSEARTAAQITISAGAACEFMVAIARECCLEIAYWLASGRAHLYRSPPEEYDRPNSLLGCIIQLASNAAYTDKRTCQAPGSSSKTAVGPGRGANKRPSVRNGAGLDAGNCRVKPRPDQHGHLPLVRCAAGHRNLVGRSSSRSPSWGAGERCSPFFTALTVQPRPNLVPARSR